MRPECIEAESSEVVAFEEFAWNPIGAQTAGILGVGRGETGMEMGGILRSASEALLLRPEIRPGLSEQNHPAHPSRYVSA